MPTTQEVIAIFDEHQAKFPSLQGQIGELKSFYTMSLWHQLTDLLLAYVNQPVFDSDGEGNELILFY